MGVVINNQGSVQIIDFLTKRFEIGPRPVRVRKQGDSLKLNWSYEAMYDANHQIIPKFNFSGTLDTNSGAIKVRGKPARFLQSVCGNGTCAVRKNLSDKQLNRLLRG